MASTHSHAPAKVVPAQLSFLTIYNPSFGQTDETAYEQIVYYYSKRDLDKRKLEDQGASHAPGKSVENEHNERLRQVGLARGMVEFANNFSNGVPVESIETEKSRIVLRELEPNWWILASIDLTQLPTAVKENQKDGKEASSAPPAIEYSAREVSPPALLVTQLQRAHSMFLIHHAVSLADLFQRIGRDLFTDILERFWNRFVVDWDVLLHGNPAIDIYNAVKLAGGGELGIGVGEEDWGSGEREVLEDFVQRTEGLVDVFVGRYGDAPTTPRKASPAKKSKVSPFEPWLGLGDESRVSDGIVFSGVGSLSRRSLAILSQWMDSVFQHGEHAYGVIDNPSSRTRHRRKRRKIDESHAGDDVGRSRPPYQEEAHPRIKSPRGKAPDYRKNAIENAATPPGIPAPLVSSVERSPGEALKKIEKRDSSRSPGRAKTTDDAGKSPEQDQLLFDTEKVMGYLKLGYGSTWTLSPKGFSKETSTAHVPSTEQAASSNQEDEPVAPEMQEVDPTPEVSDDEAEKQKAFVQYLEQSSGRFLLGLSGDLENTEFDSDPDSPDPDTESKAPPKRIFMRTLTVQMSESFILEKRSQSRYRSYRSMSIGSGGSRNTGEGKTSAAASVDGPAPNVAYEKVRVVVYVHQPFIFTFLFELQTPKLTIPAFYRSIHHQLGPLQKPLLRSTDPARIPARVLGLIGEKAGSIEPQSSNLYDLTYDPSKLTVRASIPNIPLPGTLAAEGILNSPASSASRTVSGAWYTLGIPIGSSSSSTPPLTANDGKTLLKGDWTRLEALNVHTQLLNTWSSTRSSRTARLDPSGDIERTVKTSRAWWVVWMRVPPSPPSPADTRPNSSATMRRWETDTTSECKEAFLVRKAMDVGARSKEANAKSATSARWLLRDQTRDVSGSSGASGQAAALTTARGVVEGVGVDVRRWVQGLSRLSQ